ncbi:uncharacterized protein LOC134660424 [Cydia amplana]|uniref:uncharacterized protein LOC134660424 n=1 Tax=Cydia amplana TaxID=1869771 RepID=UPI002FE512B6
MTDVKIKVTFVIPKHCSNENDCSEDMLMAYTACENHRGGGLQAQWAHEKSLSFDRPPMKNDIFVLSEFEGDLYEKLKATKCLLVGPRCLSCSLTEGSPIPSKGHPVYTVAMRGLIVTLSGLSKEAKTNLKQKIEWMGGSYSAVLSSETTHLVATNVFSDKYIKAAERGIPVMKDTWIPAVWDASLKLDINGASPEFTAHRLPPFANLQITTSGLNTHDKKLIMKLVNANGGEFSRVFLSQTTDVLVLTKDSTSSEKYKAALEFGKVCVTPHWVKDSAALGFALPVSRYKVTSTTTSSPVRDRAVPDMKFGKVCVTPHWVKDSAALGFALPVSRYKVTSTTTSSPVRDRAVPDMKFGKVCVTPHWVKDSAALGFALPVSRYKVTSTTTSSPVRDRAVPDMKFGKVCVTPHWVKDSAALGFALPVSRYKVTSTTTSSPVRDRAVPDMKFGKVCVTPHWVKDSAALGFALPVSRYKVTSTTTSSPKYKAALEFGKVCVTPHWVKDSAALGFALPVSRYKVTSTTTSSPVRDRAVPDMSLNLTRITKEGKPSNFVDESKMADSIMLSGTTKFQDSKRDSNVDEIQKAFEAFDVAAIKKAGPIFDGFCIWVSGLDGMPRERAWACVSKAGGTRYDGPNSRVTHAVSWGAAAAAAAAAALPAVPVLSPLWLIRSVEAGRVLDEAEFLINTEPATPRKASQPPIAAASPMSKRTLQLLLPPPEPIVEEQPQRDHIVDHYLSQHLSQQQAAEASKSPEPEKKEPSRNDDDTAVTVSEFTQYENIFKDLIFEVQGLEDEAICEIGAEIRAEGGVLAAAGAGGTHVLVPLDFDSNQLVTKGAEAVTVFWVKDCLSRQEVCPIEYYHRPVHLKSPASNPLHGVVASLSTYSGVERAFLDELAKLCGAAMQQRFCRRSNNSALASTHLVCPEPGGAKYCAARKWGVPVVRASWLLACAEGGVRVDEAGHSVDQEAAARPGRRPPRPSTGRCARGYVGAAAMEPAQQGVAAMEPAQQGVVAMEPAMEPAHQGVAAMEPAMEPAHQGVAAMEPAQQGAAAMKPAQQGSAAMVLARGGEAAVEQARPKPGHDGTCSTRRGGDVGSGGAESTRLGAGSESLRSSDTREARDANRARSAGEPGAARTARSAGDSGAAGRGGGRGDSMRRWRICRIVWLVPRAALEWTRRSVLLMVEAADTSHVQQNTVNAPPKTPEPKKSVPQPEEKIPEPKTNPEPEIAEPKPKSPEPEKISEPKSKPLDLDANVGHEMEQMMAPEVDEQFEGMSPASRFIAMRRMGMFSDHEDSSKENTPKKLGNETDTSVQDPGQNVRTPSIDEVLSSPNLQGFSPNTRRKLQAIRRGEIPDEPIKTPNNPFDKKIPTPDSDFGAALRPGRKRMSVDARKLLWEFVDGLPTHEPRSDTETPPSKMAKFTEDQCAGGARIPEVQTPLAPKPEDPRPGVVPLEVDEQLQRLNVVLTGRRTPRRASRVQPLQGKPADMEYESGPESQPNTVGWDDTTPSQKESFESSKPLTNVTLDNSDKTKNNLEPKEKDSKRNVESKENTANMSKVELDASNSVLKVDKAVETKIVEKKTIRRFMLSSNVDNREETVEMILRLGGLVTDLDDEASGPAGPAGPQASHLLCCAPARSQRVLNCIAGGCWVLHPAYVARSAAHGTFLPEENFEWGNPAATCLPPVTGGERVLALAAHRWRTRRARGQPGPFAGVIALLHAPEQRRKLLARLVKAGEGIVVDEEPPYTDETINVCFADPKRYPMKERDRAWLVSRRVPVCASILLSAFLTEEHRPDLNQHCLPEFRQ